MLTNIPEVKLGIIAVSRDCFIISLSERRRAAVAAACKASQWQEVTEELWNKMLGYDHQMLQTPDLFLCIGGKVLDFSNTVSLEQLKILMESEFLEAEPEDDILLICSRTEIL